MNLELQQCADEYISAIECASRLHTAGTDGGLMSEALDALDNSHRQFVAIVGRRADDRLKALPNACRPHVRRFAS
jgi:hypothetical protein